MMFSQEIIMEIAKSQESQQHIQIMETISQTKLIIKMSS